MTDKITIDVPEGFTATGFGWPKKGEWYLRQGVTPAQADMDHSGYDCDKVVLLRPKTLTIGDRLHEVALTLSAVMSPTVAKIDAIAAASDEKDRKVMEVADEIRRHNPASVGCQEWASRLEQAVRG